MSSRKTAQLDDLRCDTLWMSFGYISTFGKPDMWARPVTAHAKPDAHNRASVLLLRDVEKLADPSRRGVRRRFLEGGGLGHRGATSLEETLNRGADSAELVGATEQDVRN
jgi:hypothetical protein